MIQPRRSESVQKRISGIVFGNVIQCCVGVVQRWVVPAVSSDVSVPRKSFKERYLESVSRPPQQSELRGGRSNEQHVQHLIAPQRDKPAVVGRVTSGRSDAAVETQAEFEKKKRKLLLLLDQAVAAKMKISKVFPKKLAELGDTKRFGLDWHPGWREPDRFVPPLDCDPYRGACAVSACACDAFQTWPTEDGLYVYNPDITFAENMLCRACRHPKTEHVLATKRPRSDLPEFAPQQVAKYSLKYRAELPPAHPVDVPQFELSRFYRLNPDYPGASATTHIATLAEVEEKPTTSLADVDQGDELGDDADDGLPT
uniref:Gsp-co-occurring protein 6 n=1 Tax=Malawimonas jakobiformis TaxID=136089 RepID=A0A895KQV6_MALJA|nr:Gsp-co-occurring protein 6 [Malawimonas jakobiformis]